MKENRLETVDGLRGIFTLLLITYHVMTGVSGFSEKVIELTTRYSYLAIHLFFVLSGFLVTKNFWPRAATERHPISNFFLRRFFRLIPLWWSLLFILFVLNDFSFKVLIANMFYYFGFFSYDSSYLPLEPAWTLFVEETFYLIFPFLFLYLGSSKIIFAIIFSMLLSGYWITYAPIIGIPNDNWFMTRFPLANFKYFMYGVGYSLLYSNSDSWNKFWVGKKYWVDFLLFLSLVALTLNASVHREILLILILTISLLTDSLVYKILKIEALQWVGIRCYGFYLLHVPIIGILTSFLNQSWSENSQNSPVLKFSLLAASTFATTALIAGISYRWLEKPFINLGKSIIKKRESAA